MYGSQNLEATQMFINKNVNKLQCNQARLPMFSAAWINPKSLCWIKGITQIDTRKPTYYNMTPFHSPMTDVTIHERKEHFGVSAFVAGIRFQFGPQLPDDGDEEWRARGKIMNNRNQNSLSLGKEWNLLEMGIRKLLRCLAAGYTDPQWWQNTLNLRIL